MNIQNLEASIVAAEAELQAKQDILDNFRVDQKSPFASGHALIQRREFLRNQIFDYLEGMPINPLDIPGAGGQIYPRVFEEFSKIEPAANLVENSLRFKEACASVGPLVDAVHAARAAAAAARSALAEFTEAIAAAKRDATAAAMAAVEAEFAAPEPAKPSRTKAA